MREITNSLFIIGETPKGSVSALPDKAGGLRAFAEILTHVASAQESFEQVTRRLIRLCEIAYGQRDYKRLREITEALQSIPFTPAQNAARYYQAVLLKRQGELDRAASLLGDLSAPRALLTLGTIEEYRGDFDSAARLHVEAMKASRGVDAFTYAGAAMQLATIKAVSGDHAGSLHSFQSIGPLVRLAAASQPYLWPLYCNAVAVELSELGRVEEARRASAVAVASPIAEAYPEWQETKREIEQAQPARLVVAVPQREESEPASLSENGSEPRRITADCPQSPFTNSPTTRAPLQNHQPRAPPSLFGLLTADKKTGEIVSLVLLNGDGPGKPSKLNPWPGLPARRVKARKEHLNNDARIQSDARAPQGHGRHRQR
jgi:tetratricopeptide (TPR) repeat protein